MEKPTSEQLFEFRKIQFEQSIETIRKAHNILHVSISTLISVDVGVIGYAIKNELYLLISFGTVLTLLIYLSWTRVRKMAFAAFVTAICIERSFINTPLFNFLGSTYYSLVYSYEDYTKIISIIDAKLHPEKSKDKFKEKESVSLIQETKLNVDFGKKSNFLTILLFIIIAQFVTGIIWQLFYKGILSF